MRRYDIFVGIDPGASGGIAKLSENGIVFKSTPFDLFDMFALTQGEPFFPEKDRHRTLVAIELVGGYIGMPQPGSAMFQFGRNFGRWEAFIAANLAGGFGQNLDYVRPQEWQKVLEIPARVKTKGAIKGETTARWKARLKRFAEELFPSLKITGSTADALLIAEYARRTYK